MPLALQSKIRNYVYTLVKFTLIFGECARYRTEKYQ